MCDDTIEDEGFNTRLVDGKVLARLKVEGDKVTIFNILATPPDSGLGTQAMRELRANYKTIWAIGIIEQKIQFWQKMLRLKLLDKGFLLDGDGDVELTLPQS